MSSRRVLKVAQAIRQVVSMAILTELRDPRVKDVTVTFVEVSSDLRNAKVHVSVMGDETSQQLALRGLRNAAGFLQQKVGDRIDMRYTPRIRFELDQGVKNSIEVSRILGELLPDGASGAPGPSEMGPSEMGPSEMGPSEMGPSETGPSETLAEESLPDAGGDAQGPVSKELDS
jgi:ribosome-binding factor A